MEDLDISGLTAEGNFGTVNTCIRELTMPILQFRDEHIQIFYIISEIQPQFWRGAIGEDT